MSGFVYIWHDRKKKRFYVGSHWGPEDDGYVCSSRWMRNTYKRRPETFKRRVVARVTTSRTDLFTEEDRWLQMIPAEQLGKRYYNLIRTTKHHWLNDPEHAKNTIERISASVKAYFETEEGQKTRKKFSKKFKGKKTGPREPSVGQKISESLKGKPLTEEHKEAVRQTLTGRKLSEEHKANIRKGHNRDYSCPEFRRKCSEARRRTLAAKSG